ncbi:uncharacterized protein LOC132049075 [Lycium ferocissimum]|uniref:uncharacterized protein LOC132049075 n=1 Tax=Lycium ferocissimum TaxID=112874 RepID=UPI002815E24E|nr:uncharacterized protein LOC132049075 [Lycium ferocissimum]
MRIQLKNEERQAIAEWLLKESNGGKLKRGSLKQAEILFHTPNRTMRRIWRQVRSSISHGNSLDVSTKYVGIVGRKRVHIDVNLVKENPLCRRRNIRSLACAINMSSSTVHRRVKEGAIRSHTNAIKPYLTETNKKARVQFCLSMIASGTLHSNPMFIDMYNYVHMDEKWFFLTKKSAKFYLLPEEEEPNPYRSCKSKNYITKVMFMSAVARPRFDEDGVQLFSGKIGIFPFVLPAIQSKWPLSDSNSPIFIQQDNARPHLSVDDFEFNEAAQQDEFDIRLCFQLANSPDLNVLDLGFFRAIQSLQHTMAPTNIDELISAVEKSFNEMEVERLNHVFLTLQSCMVEVMKDKGGNNYKVPHMKKDMLEGQGNLPIQEYSFCFLMTVVLLSSLILAVSITLLSLSTVFGHQREHRGSSAPIPSPLFLS